MTTDTELIYSFSLLSLRFLPNSSSKPFFYSTPPLLSFSALSHGVYSRSGGFLKSLRVTVALSVCVCQNHWARVMGLFSRPLQLFCHWMIQQTGRNHQILARIFPFCCSHTTSFYIRVYISNTCTPINIRPRSLSDNYTREKMRGASAMHSCSSHMFSRGGKFKCLQSTARAATLPGLQL